MTGFDVFKKHGTGVLWCAQAKTLAEANAKVEKLRDGKTEFVIFDQDTQEKIIVKPEPRSR